MNTRSNILIIGEEPEIQLFYFHDGFDVPEYKSQIVSNSLKEEFIDYCIKDEPELKSLSFEELYLKFGDEWNGSSWRRNQYGVWEEWSTYNPNTKLGQYQLVSSIPKEEQILGNELPLILKNGHTVDQAFKREIQSIAINDISNFIIDGMWIECEKDFQKKEVLSIIESVTDNTLVSVYECFLYQ